MRRRLVRAVYRRRAPRNLLERFAAYAEQHFDASAGPPPGAAPVPA